MRPGNLRADLRPGGRVRVHQNPTTRCSKCDAKIAFTVTSSGKWMPVDADSLNDEDVELLGRVGGEKVEYRHGDHMSHFATCPEADSFRKKKR